VPDVVAGLVLVRAPTRRWPHTRSRRSRACNRRRGLAAGLAICATSRRRP